MLTQNLPPRGVVLTVTHIQRYMDVVQEVIGHQPTMELLMWAQHTYRYDSDDSVLASLLAYYDGDDNRNGHGYRRPLDYALLSIVLYGLFAYYGEETAAVLSGRIGAGLWCGPQYLIRLKSGEQPWWKNLFWGVQRYEKIANPHGGLFHELANIPADRGALLAHVTAHLREQDGIAVEYVKTSRGHELHIDSCPYCNNQLSHCRVWWGLAHAMLGMAEQSPDVTPMNRQLSRAHHLIIET
ncbi:MAG: hypothetical protein D6712_15655 [Chloroflexi bacterium]|nr:MAG: hypothetical protein D6712_15655 [Chloroflexota bacterium]